MSNRLLSNAPQFYDSHGSPSAIKYGIDITVLQDDVTTVALLTNAKSGAHIATGYARRHPLDERNPEIGHDLAVARAFHRLAERYAGKAEGLISPPQDPMKEPLRAMKRHNRAEKQKIKNERRREARERYLRETSKAAGEQLTQDEISDALARAFGDWTDK